MKSTRILGLAALLSSALVSGQALASDTQPIWQQYLPADTAGVASGKVTAPIWQPQLDALRKGQPAPEGYAINNPNRPIWSGHLGKII